jgi:hypothetical protein
MKTVIHYFKNTKYYYGNKITQSVDKNIAPLCGRSIFVCTVCD